MEKLQHNEGDSGGEDEDDEDIHLSTPSLPPVNHQETVAAAHAKGSKGARMFNLVLPTIIQNQSLEKDISDDVTNNDESTVSKLYDFPVIPPRGLTEVFKMPEDPSEEAVWFRVLTPREIKGIDGPYSEVELKDLYKSGNLKDTTMLWKEGERDWKQLLLLKDLRPRLLQMPLIPPRIGTNDPFAGVDDGEFTVDKKVDAQAYNPIVHLPTGTEIENLKPLSVIPLNDTCSRCGSFAVGHLQGHGRTEVDMVSLRKMKEYPKDLVSEIIPGLLYIGHSGAAKLNPLLEMNISLIINCTNNLANPPDRIPYYRGKTIPLKDKPKSDRPANMAAMLETLEKACDWMENERLTPERAVLSDPVPAPLKLKRTTDKYGRLIRSVEEIGMKRRAGMDGNKKPPPRILLWSRKGFDRPSFIAAAYMIRQYGFDVERTINMIETARPGASISRAYRAALDEFSKKHTKGELLCQDCIANARLSAEVDKFMAGQSDTGEIALAGAARSRARDSCHARFAAAMEALSRPPATTPGMDATLGHNPLAALGDISSYFSVVMYGRTLQSGWTGLLDLQLVSRRLGDAAIGQLFDALTVTQCLLHLRCVNVKGNDLTCQGTGRVFDALAACPALMTLNLSCNKIQLEGACRISAFILSNETVTSLDVSSNPLGDEGVAAIFQCITMPRADFEGGDIGDSLAYNRALTSLDVGFTELGHEAAGALVNVLRDNATLTSLSLDFNVEFSAKDMKHVFNSMRSYNRSLLRMSLANTPISTKSIGYLSRVFENRDLPLMRLDLSSCALVSTHVAYLAKQLPAARCLTNLIMSSNAIGNLGAEYLAKGIIGQVDETSGQLWPPLQHVDLAFCSIDTEGCRVLLAAISSRTTITSLNMSYNKIGEALEESAIIAGLKLSRLADVRFNGCQLHSKGAAQLLDSLCDTSSEVWGSHLRALYIADNSIHDRASESVKRLLQQNMQIEVLDLGYNLFSPDCQENMAAAKRVVSTDSKERKVYSLTVNMVGNNCDPYMLDAPGLSRSKTNFRFGIKSSTVDEINDGFSHIPLSSRPLHRLRTDANEAAQKIVGRYDIPINTLSM